MILKILILLIGFVLLIKGADILVDGASTTAKNLKISSLAIGFVVVAFGTSFPELAVSIKAIYSNNGDMVLGNVIGSSISNILLIIGISSLLGKVIIKQNTIKKQIPILIILSLVLGVLFSDSLFCNQKSKFISRFDGIIILILFVLFMYHLRNILKASKKENIVIKDIKNITFIKSIILVVIGLISLILGSNLVVDNVEYIARYLNISDRVISFTIIALGTSLPELVSAIVAIRKGEQDILMGSIVGSNIFNIGIVLALPVALFGGIDASSFSYVDIIVLIASSILLYLFAKSGNRISKLEGLLMVILYFIYYSYVIFV